MPVLSTLTLANGAKVTLSTTEAPRNGSYQLQAEITDAAGAVYRVIVVDTATNSDGSTSPPRGESFANAKLIGLSGGGFAVAYDNTVLNAPGGSNSSEVRLYDAAGALSGSISRGTSHGGQPYPWQGGPEITATASNGVALVYSTVSGTYLELFDSIGQQEGQRTYSARPTAVVDLGYSNQVAITYTEGGVLMRDVRPHGLADPPASSGAVTVVSGAAAGDVLTSTAGPDDLYGLAGDDTLQGGPGSDRLFGGDGADRFVLALDGSVDQIVDFDPARDTLSLVDANGAVVASGSGILTFWRANGVLTWDADGDQGPGAPVTVGVLTGVGNLSAGNFAPGFEPALVRYVNPVDLGRAVPSYSHSDVTYGFGKQPFLQASADYGLGTATSAPLLTYVVDWANGRQSAKWFDYDNSQTWDSLVADFDAQHRLEIYATFNDDGSHVLHTFDVASSQVWSRIVDEYDAAGRLEYRAVVYDDGSRYEATFDVANTQPWGYVVDGYDAVGRLTSHTFYNDNGTVFG